MTPRLKTIAVVWALALLTLALAAADGSPLHGLFFEERMVTAVRLIEPGGSIPYSGWRVVRSAAATNDLYLVQIERSRLRLPGTD